MLSGSALGKMQPAGVLDHPDVIPKPQLDAQARDAGAAAVAEVPNRITPCPGARAAATSSSL
jgi:hypothetical protein